MSNVTSHPQYAELSFPNTSSIQQSKWFFSAIDEERIGDRVRNLGLLIGVGVATTLAFIVGGFYSEVFNEAVAPVVGMVVFAVVLFVGAFFLSPITGKFVDAKERKRDRYRALHAAALVDTLAEQGWTIEGRSPVETVINDNTSYFPYIRNEEGVRYYVQHLSFNPEGVNFSLSLSDVEVQQAKKNAEKQGRIDFLLSQYEADTGELTPEHRKVFVAALQRGL